MKVIEICYTDNTQTTVKTLYEDNTASYGPYPANDGPTRQAQDEFINSGGTITEYISPPPAPVTQVTAYQARIALLNSGLLSQVELAVAESTNSAVKIAWEYATIFDINSHFILDIAENLNLSTEDIDNLFIEANKVT